MRELGCDRRTISAEEAVRMEPALVHVKDRLVGATYTPADESGDAQRFTVELSRIAAAAGVKFLFSHDIKALRAHGGKIDYVEATAADGKFVRLQADAYVLALGCFSPLLAAPLGVRLNIYPAKGYSVTMPVADPARAYEVSLTDDEYKLVFSRLGERLRIAGTAEMNGYDRSLNRVRCEAIVRRTQELFPGGGDASRAQFWSGLRPATPSNVPYIGKSRLENLYLNTGHGTLGWTHACGSGHALADIVCGRKAEVEFDFAGGNAREFGVPVGRIRPQGNAW
jgi:D-amino-acid dehydrogenase